MSETLRIVARIAAAPDMADALEVEMKVLVEETRREAGCLQYDLLRGLEDGHLFVFVEEWETKALWDAHMAGDAIASFNERIGSGMIASSEILQLGPVEPQTHEDQSARALSATSSPAASWRSAASCWRRHISA